jgi:hypothetical protein
MSGFTHTALPLLSRETLIVTDESVQPGAKDWPKPAWVVDMHDETRPMIIGTLPLPDAEGFAERGGRFGAHNLHENYPSPQSFRSEDLVFGAFFNAGVRVYDVRDPYQPQEVAWYIPPMPEGSSRPTAQVNDVFVDDRGIVFAVDRHAGGLYALEMKL